MRGLARLVRRLGRVAWRIIRWPWRAHGTERVLRLLGVILLAAVVADLVGEAWSAISRWVRGHETDGLLAAIALAAALLALALVRAVRADLRRRSKDPHHVISAHVPASAAVVATGALLGAAPTAVLPFIPAVVVTAAAVAATLAAALALAHQQRGAVPWPALALESAWRHRPTLVAAAGLLGVGVLVVAAIAHVPGGDAGAAAGAALLIAADRDEAKRRAAELHAWYERARAALGPERLHRLWVTPPRQEDVLAAQSAKVQPEWGAVILCDRRTLAGQVESAATALRAVLGPEWSVDADPVARRLEARPHPLLPELALAPTAPGKRYQLPVGVGRGGREVVWDVAADPHALVCGQTGSGKTVLLVNLLLQALLRGWQVAVVDATKGALDYTNLDPWSVATARDLPTAAAVVKWVYDEVVARRKLLAECGAVKVPDLPEGVRPPPLLVVLDEYFSLIARLTAKTELAQRDNQLKDVIADSVSRVAREARYADIHVVLAAQRPDATVFAGELKSNIGARVLAGPADDIARRMALRSPESAPVPPKGAKGRAVIESDAEDAIEVQLYLVATAPDDRSRSLGAPLPSEQLEKNRVPHARKVNLVLPEDGEKEPPPARTRRAAAAASDVAAGAPDGGMRGVDESPRARRFSRPPPLPPV